MDYSKQLLAYSLAYEGNWNQIARAIQEKVKVQGIPYQGQWVSILDEAYPACFRQLRYPPWVLFYRGDLSLLTQDCVGIVGSRQASSYGLAITRQLVSWLEDRVIVSGLAKGIDGQAHRYAKRSIGILGTGIDRIYPACHQTLFKQVDLLVSEYPGLTAGRPAHFPWRNRLIAAASQTLIVVECKRKSGTIHTVDWANELGKRILCVPRDLGCEYDGCNWLISQGLEPILGKESLI